eukprot:SAG22_NODE_133_length_18379_cov_34.571937_1_plen_1946_part_00
MRLHFHAVVYLPLGQTPVIAKLQNLAHMQCTGQELSAELSSDEKKERLQQAMSGKKILLCLDDVWEEENLLELDFVDVSAGSKVLISTRMKVLLDGGHQVEVGLPSPSDSARMLLAAADADVTASQPSGVSEIVALCGRLPLTLGIAGRLAASLGLVGSQDWNGMTGVLKEELREGHSGGAEEGMIRASLRGLKGSAKERANVRSLLLLFAFVPEDTPCPLEAMLLMFNALHAVNEGSGATMMHVRKWLRILINRSLVLGMISAPSVHDLVLDWAVAQHTDAELRESHRLIVDAFRIARPTDTYGRRKYLLFARDPVASYVCNEIETHVRGSGVTHEVEGRNWHLHLPTGDAIAVATGRMIGTERLSKLALDAEAVQDWWLAARLWASLSTTQSSWTGVDAVASDAATKCLSAIAKLPAQSQSMDVEDLRFSQASIIIRNFDLDVVAKHLSEFEEIAASAASRRDPGGTFAIRSLLTIVYPRHSDTWTGDITKLVENCVSLTAAAQAAAIEHPDPEQRHKCYMLQFGFSIYWELSMLSPSFDWTKQFGPNGSLLMEVLRSYDYDTHHSMLVGTANGDWLNCTLAAWPILLHWGDVENFVELAQRAQRVMKRILAQPWEDEDHSAIMFCPSMQAHFYICTSLQEGRSTVVENLEEAGLTYESADATIDTCKTPWIRKRGDTTIDAYWGSAEFIVWMAKLGYVLIAPNRAPAAKGVLASMPSVDEIIEMTMTFKNISQQHGLQGLYNLFHLAAGVCEKFAAHELALEYIEAGLSRDLRRAGTLQPISRIHLQILRGRVLASLNRLADACNALETAAAEARRYEVPLYEVFALRDLKLCVLDPMGHSDHASRRVGAALRLLKGPGEKLTQMLHGLDAAELIALPAPDPNYRVVFEAPMQQELRAELSAMKIKALKKRAREVSVDEERLEDADDEDDVKAVVIALILGELKKKQAPAAAGGLSPAEEHGADVGGGTAIENGDDPALVAMRSELRALKVSDLQKRAVTAGVGSSAVEAALDSDDSKTTLVELLVKRRREVGATADVLPALQAGGNDAVTLLGTCLEHAVDVLDTLSTSLPRRERKGMIEQIDRVESMLESSAEWCEGLSHSDGSEIERLGSAVVGVMALTKTTAESREPVQAAVLELLECLELFGNVVLRSLSVLSADGGDGEQSIESCVMALEALRALSEEHQDAVSSEEVSAAVAILPHMAEGRPLGVRVSANMALFTLGCRHGLAIVNADSVSDAMCKSLAIGSAALMAEAGSGSASDDACALAAASGLFVNFLGECIGKSPLAMRASLDKPVQQAIGDRILSSKSCSDDSALKVVSSMMERQVLESSDLSLACGYIFVLGMQLMYVRLYLVPVIESTGVVLAALSVQDRVCASGFIADTDWWISTATVVSVQAVQVSMIYVLYAAASGLPGETLLACAWMRAGLKRCVDIVKANHSAGVCARDTASALVIGLSAQVISILSSKCDAIQSTLLEPSVMDALEYTSVNDFYVLGKSPAAEAAAVLVRLVGRNEGGKTLSRATVNAVMQDLKENLRFEGRKKARALTATLMNVTNTATMAISDANKMLMLESEGAIDTIVSGLLLTSVRRSEKGADALQEACAALLLSLALYKPWAEALRAHAGAMCALHDLKDGDAGTEASRRIAESALFELEGRKALLSSEAADSGKGSKHVMISYCWDQQQTIKRVHAALASRGYNCWIDIEQMTGSTVDSMALAVENAEVMLIGVSRQYKESTNCRLEAQYAMQREVPTIPLMLADGYRADGWLGMLIGTRMWYGFYGAVLSDASLFEQRMSELCRDLGERGKKGTVSAVGHSVAVVPASNKEEELAALSSKQLRTRAAEIGATAEQLDAAADADDMHLALIALVLALDQAVRADTAAGTAAQREELNGLSNKELRARAKEVGATTEQLADAADADDMRAALISLIVELEEEGAS